MTRLLLILAISSCNLFAGFTWCVPVTFNNHPASTLTDYPAMFCANGATGAFCDSVAHSNLVLGILKTVGNGGAVTSASGYDIGWFSDAACTVTVPFQLVPGVYAPTTGLIEMRVKIASLSSSADTIMYMGVGNAAITTDQSSTSTWPSTFKAVYPFPNGSSLTLTDATSNARTVTIGGNLMIGGTGQIDGAIVQAGSGTATASSTGLPAGTSDRTFSFWWGTTTLGNFTSILSYGTDGANGRLQQPNAIDQCGGAGCCGPGNTGANYKIGIYGWGADVTGGSNYCVIPNGAMHHVVYTFDGTTVSIYVDGAFNYSATPTWNTVLGANLGITTPATGFGSCPGCRLDQVEIADTVLSTAWITADYNNGSEPWNFYTIGTPAASIVRHRVTQ